MTGMQTKRGTTSPAKRIRENQARVRSRLAEDGGKVLNTHLSGDANRALQAIVARGVTQRQAIEYALMAYAKQLSQVSSLLTKGLKT